MARNKGGIVLVDNYEVKLEGALDPRVAVASKGDLIVRNTWPNDGGDPYLYDGLIVGVADEKAVYMLVDKSKALAEDYSGWVRIDAGGVKIDNIFTYKSSVASYDSLPVVNEVGDVYNVEAEFTLTVGEGETAEVKTYPAGTNVAWNGEAWDPLAGSIDLSNYATKQEVAGVRADVTANASAIEALGTELGNAKAEIASKVEAVEGYSLISADKLALIDTNASDIQALEDKNLDSRISTLEGMFKGEGGNIDLSDITETLSQNTTRISNLESGKVDNTTFNQLSATVSDNTGKISQIITINAQQTTDISTLNTTTSNNTTAISGLTTTVGNHTTSIGNLQTDLSEVSTKVGVIEADYLKAADISGKLDTTTYNEKVALLEAADKTNSDAIGVVASDLADEISRAKKAEEANAAAIKAEKDRLDLFLNEATLEGDVIDTLVEIQEYITNHGTEASNLLTAVQTAQGAADKAQGDVDALTTVVTALDAAYKTADATTLTAANKYTDDAITALSLGSASKKDVSFFATAEQGAKADAAAPQATTYTKTEVDAMFTWIDVTNE